MKSLIRRWILLYPFLWGSEPSLHGETGIAANIADFPTKQLSRFLPAAAPPNADLITWIPWTWPAEHSSRGQTGSVLPDKQSRLLFLNHRQSQQVWKKLINKRKSWPLIGASVSFTFSPLIFYLSILLLFAVRPQWSSRAPLISLWLAMHWIWHHSHIFLCVSVMFFISISCTRCIF